MTYGEELESAINGAQMIMTREMVRLRRLATEQGISQQLEARQQAVNELQKQLDAERAAQVERVAKFGSTMEMAYGKASPSDPARKEALESIVQNALREQPKPEAPKDNVYVLNDGRPQHKAVKGARTAEEREQGIAARVRKHMTPRVPYVPGALDESEEEQAPQPPQSERAAAREALGDDRHKLIPAAYYVLRTYGAMSKKALAKKMKQLRVGPPESTNLAGYLAEMSKDPHRARFSHDKITGLWSAVMTPVAEPAEDETDEIAADDRTSPTAQGVPPEQALARILSALGPTTEAFATKRMKQCGYRVDVLGLLRAHPDKFVERDGWWANSNSTSEPEPTTWNLSDPAEAAAEEMTRPPQPQPTAAE